MAEDINLLALVKGAERYVVLYDNASGAEALRLLGRWASNPDLSFTWYDCAVLAQRVRQNSQSILFSYEASSQPINSNKTQLRFAYNPDKKSGIFILALDN
jgi:hypothetical protein